MQIKSKDDRNGWNLFQRIYKSRCKTEIQYTELVLKWFEDEKNKSLDKLEEILDKFSKENVAAGKIVRTRNASGRYITEPFEREFKIELSKPNRYSFIQISEPFKTA